jgi:hypothetical protein
VNDLVECDPERERDDDEDLPDEPVVAALVMSLIVTAVSLRLVRVR